MNYVDYISRGGRSLLRVVKSWASCTESPVSESSVEAAKPKGNGLGA